MYYYSNGPASEEKWKDFNLLIHPYPVTVVIATFTVSSQSLSYHYVNYYEQQIHHQFSESPSGCTFDAAAVWLWSGKFRGPRLWSLIDRSLIAANSFGKHVPLFKIAIPNGSTWRLRWRRIIYNLKCTTLVCPHPTAIRTLTSGTWSLRTKAWGTAIQVMEL